MLPKYKPQKMNSEWKRDQKTSTGTFVQVTFIIVKFSNL